MDYTATIEKVLHDWMAAHPGETTDTITALLARGNNVATVYHDAVLINLEKRKRAPKCSADEIDLIVALATAGVPHQTSGRVVGRTENTSCTHYRKYMRAAHEHRTKDAGLDGQREELISKHEQARTDARRHINRLEQQIAGARTLAGPAADVTKLDDTLVKYLTAEASALRHIERLTGVAAPTRTEITGANGGPIETRDLSKLSDDELRKLAGN